jgi:hypothetical protein
MQNKVRFKKVSFSLCKKVVVSLKLKSFLNQLHDQMIHFQLIQLIYLQFQGHDCKFLWDLTPEYLKNSFTV